MQETLEMHVESLGRKDSLKEEMATHSSILAWRIPWTEEPGGLQSIKPQRVRHVWACMHACMHPIGKHSPPQVIDISLKRIIFRQSEMVNECLTIAFHIYNKICNWERETQREGKKERRERRWVSRSKESRELQESE